MAPKHAGYAGDDDAVTDNIVNDEAVAELLQENENENEEMSQELQQLMSEFSEMDLNEMNMDTLTGSSSDDLQTIAERFKAQADDFVKRQKLLLKEVENRPRRTTKEADICLKAERKEAIDRAKQGHLDAPRMIRVQFPNTSCVLNVTVTLGMTVGDVRRAVMEALSEALKEKGMKKALAKDIAFQLSLFVNGKALHLRPRLPLDSAVVMADMQTDFIATLPPKVLTKVHPFFPVTEDEEDDDEVDEGTDQSDEPDDGDEPSEPNDDGGEPSEGGDSNQSPFLTVFAKFQEQTLQFGLNEGNSSVSNLGKLGIPWFQLSVQVEGHQLDDFEDLFDYAPEIADETLGLIVYVELFHYDTERPQNIVNVIVVEQYGERRQFNLELLSATLYLNIKDFVRDYLSELLELHHHDIILRYNNDDLECAPLGSHPASAQELMMEVSIVGKGGVISRHRAEALEDLKKKVIKNIKKTKTPTDATFPEAFTTYMESVKRKTQDIVFMKTQGIRVVDAGLRALSDEQLET
ncbi:unnamed protein product, partial [Effrenium voratum]